jgi:hypothetical protein
MGEEGRIGVAAYDATGAPVNSPEVAWSSNIPTIARISTAGVVTAIAPGRATITALWRGVYASSGVEVRARTLRILPDPGSTTLVIGGKLELIAHLTDDKGHPLSDPIQTSWSSSDSNVAVVANFPPGNGRVAVVTAVGSGQTTISARVGPLSAIITIAVLEPLSGGSDGIAIRDAHIVEYQYPSAPDWWFYAPIIRVTGGSGGADLFKLRIPLPGKGANPGFCGSIRVLPFQTLDLNVELYGDYQISIDGGRGYRVPPGSVFQGTLEYRRGDGVMVTQSFDMPMVSGDLPTTYSGGFGLWGSCLPPGP